MKRYGLIGLGALILIVAWVSNTGGATLEASPAVSPTWTRVAPPTLTPTPSPSSVPPSPPPTVTPAALLPRDGAAIWLRVQGSAGDPRWQNLWTVVQWQDALGDWHDVEGWRGTLDEIVAGEGRKVWWLPAALFGAGPFRWVVYAQCDGERLAISPEFHLPAAPGHIELVTVKLLF